MSEHTSSPASQLLGKSLDGGWRVLERVKRLPAQTGRLFSEGYIVVDGMGKRAFLKALDYSRALRSDDPAAKLLDLTRGYIFERDLLRRCQGMDRVVRGVAAGSTNVEADDGRSEVVQYLILELADQGDVRKFLDLSRRLNTAWILRSLQHVATGIWQLHSANIAHQDVKPSNILVFESVISKVADLGSASSLGEVPPHESDTIPGDPAYAPLELRYGYILPDWKHRRFGCDLFMLGSLAVFFFGRANLTAVILDALHPSHRPGAWQGSYAEVLPYVRAAFERAMDCFREDVRREAPHLVEDLVEIVRQLSDPDPNIRGDPRERTPTKNQFSLERYLTRFDLLARREEYRLANL